MADYNNIALNTTAERIERMANMEINTENIDEYSDDYSLPTSKAVYRAIVSSGGGTASGDYVSYSEEQSLTDEQKETARQNIGVFSQNQVAEMINGSFEEAVPKSLVVDNLVADKQLLVDHIPNGQAVQSFIEANSVSSAVTQSLSESKKAIARENIGAAPLEVWETIADITFEEAVGVIKINQDTDGQEFSLKRAKIIVDTDNTTNFYTATGTLMMGLMSADNGVSARSMFLYNFIPDTAGKYSRAFFEIELVDGMAFISGCCKNNLAALNNGEFASSFTKYSNLPFAAMNGIINNISVSTNYKNGFAIGTHIKILGVRA